MHAELAAQPVAEKTQQKRSKILIIDDDAEMVSILQERMERMGYRVNAALDGPQGMHSARLDPPDLVLLDLRLPTSDGLSVCQQLTDAPETCGIPVIIVSGMERPDIVRRSRAVGCQYFVRKPYDPSALLVLVEHALAESN